MVLHVHDNINIYYVLLMFLFQIMPELKKNFQRVVAVDFLGFGFSDKPVSLIITCAICAYYEKIYYLSLLGQRIPLFLFLFIFYFGKKFSHV